MAQSSFGIFIEGPIKYCLFIVPGGCLFPSSRLGYLELSWKTGKMSRKTEAKFNRNLRVHDFLDDLTNNR